MAPFCFVVDFASGAISLRVQSGLATSNQWIRDRNKEFKEMKFR
jgi:hypothetical protein